VFDTFVINLCVNSAALRFKPEKPADALFICRVRNHLEALIEFVRVNIPVTYAVSPVCFYRVPTGINPIIVNRFRKPFGK
jgi:hypothetical protein